MKIHFFKKKNTRYILIQDKKFDIEFAKEKVIIIQNNLQVASLELSHSFGLVNPEFRIIPSGFLEFGYGSVVPINTHYWIVTIPSTQLPGQWSTYEIIKTKSGWKIITLNPLLVKGKKYPLTKINTSPKVANFVRQNSGSKLGYLEFNTELLRKDTIFLTLTLALAIQSKSYRPMFSLFPPSPVPVINPKTYQQVCQSLHRPKRQNSFKAFLNRI